MGHTISKTRQSFLVLESGLRAFAELRVSSMTALEPPALQQLTLRVLKSYVGSDADAAQLAAAARRAYDELARACAPLIGQRGVETLMTRAVHLAQREHPWLLQAPERQDGEHPFGHIEPCLTRQDGPTASAAGARVLANLAGLLVVLIGEGLTARLLRAAWPAGFFDEHEEADTQ